jgi:hypothetical protein
MIIDTTTQQVIAYERLDQIISDALLKGYSHRAIGSMLGMPASTVFYRAKLNEVKAPRGYRGLQNLDYEKLRTEYKVEIK